MSCTRILKRGARAGQECGKKISQKRKKSGNIFCNTHDTLRLKREIKLREGERRYDFSHLRVSKRLRRILENDALTRERDSIQTIRYYAFQYIKQGWERDRESIMRLAMSPTLRKNIIEINSAEICNHIRNEILDSPLYTHWQIYKIERAKDNYIRSWNRQFHYGMCQALRLLDKRFFEFFHTDLNESHCPQYVSELHVFHPHSNTFTFIPTFTNSFYQILTYSPTFQELLANRTIPCQDDRKRAILEITDEVFRRTVPQKLRLITIETKREMKSSLLSLERINLTNQVFCNAFALSSNEYFRQHILSGDFKEIDPKVIYERFLKDPIYQRFIDGSKEIERKWIMSQVSQSVKQYWTLKYSKILQTTFKRQLVSIRFNEISPGIFAGTFSEEPVVVRLVSGVKWVSKSGNYQGKKLKFSNRDWFLPEDTAKNHYDVKPVLEGFLCPPMADIILEYHC